MLSDRKRDQTTNFLLFIVFAIWGTLAAVFTIFDLEISQLFYNGDSIWGNIGADYGEIPGYILIFISVGILFGSLLKNKHQQKNYFRICG